MRCEYWDCGWCFAPNSARSNDDIGACNKPHECQELKRQENEPETKRPDRPPEAGE